jgi:hypothetical protein
MPSGGWGREKGIRVRGWGASGGERVRASARHTPVETEDVVS